MKEDEKTLSGEVVLEVGGERFELELTIPAVSVKPQRMLPVFQKITNTIVARGIERSEARGESISCKPACGACCRQPLLISEAEVFNLAKLIEQMPPERRSVIEKRFEDGIARFRDINWFGRFDDMTRRAIDTPTKELEVEFVSLLTEYINERVACPFLENESCSIYEDRPLVCREYLVTSPAENCANPRPYNTRKLPISGSSSKAFARLCGASNSSNPSSLLLIRTLEFVKANEDNLRTNEGPAWVEDFFKMLTHSPEAGLPSEQRGVSG